MTPADFAFFVLAAFLVVAALGVVATRNPVHGVLLLVLAFFNASGIFVLLGAEFLAMLLVIVYVGAVMVLFLFVVMMLRIGEKEYENRARGAFMAALVIVGIIFVELGSIVVGFRVLESAALPAFPEPIHISNAKALGRILYTDYIFAFQAAGLILLIAMLGAIVLVHRKRPGVKRQNIANQIARDPKDILELHKIEPNTETI